MLKSLLSLLQKKGDSVIAIECDQCDLRTLVESDATSLAILLSDNKYFWSTYEPLHRPDFYTVEAQRRKIAENLMLLAEKREFSFGIFAKGTNKLIGHISLYAVKRLPYSSAFVGYSMDERYAGRGIATAATRAVVQFAFNQVGVHRVEAYVSPRNEASIRVLEKTGFTREGLLRKLLFINGEWVDHFMYAILQEDENARR
ncbi:GNAT family protein [Solibacillus sp. CAU 1738]|uniref:GNAT family N-acetyltransferase n=1 Tax=Solibacillus sp. CAU 1738 TaxID=3140363 RepID=UPI00326131F0